MDSPIPKESTSIETSRETDKVAPPKFIEKLRNKSELTRKIILWAIVAILAAGLLFVWLRNTKKKLESLNKEEIRQKLQLPALEKDLRGLPKVELPGVNEGELKEMEEELKELEKQTPPENQ